ncbi:TPA: hypothetical protein RTF98_000316 [Campylobacter jejuni]|nr:hypothetical protein [Campylobacter jejuni]HDZ4937046.1 hypothetical protein [Campylobacter jejuni]HDZ4939937.1 hypothetical protein [Campylobacter jejuni]HDZ4943264.1 hypothetical protein [Campylobacter jejuni]HDZ4945358.1 hypothetical protein [Campylobacter jejuni]
MFYILNENDKKYLNDTLEKVNKKIQDLQDKNEQENLNKAKHLNECKNSLEACLNKSDDKYDFFIYEIYTFVWGEKQAILLPEDELKQTNSKIDKTQINIPTLKELAQSVIKEEVENRINNSLKMQERLQEFNENGIPRKITIRQAKLALLEAGLLDDIETMMQSAPKAIQINWEYATEFERENELILFFQQQAKLSDEFVNELFKKAKGF